MGKLSSFSDALLEDSAELSFMGSQVGERGEAPEAAHPSEEHPKKATIQNPVPAAEPGTQVPVTEDAEATQAPAAPNSTKTANATPTKEPTAEPPAEKVAGEQPPGPASEPKAPAGADKARWTQLQRKEFRMHNVQADSLATLTRKVNRMSPRDPDERVTDNTLIRVGLALLLELHKDDLRGKNERELRESVGLPPDLPDED